jgi:hypothetical protein
MNSLFMRIRYSTKCLVWSAMLLLAQSTTFNAPGRETERPHRLSGSAARAEADQRKRTFPLGYIPPGARERALEQIRLADGAPGAPNPQITFSQWYNIGPAPIIQSPYGGSDGLCSGRVTAFGVDPSSPTNHWLLGAAQGGIWETTDGASWKERTDAQASLAMGAIAFAPSAPATVYAGTGEPNFRGDDYAGAGLLVSYDHGTHWQMLNTNFAETSFSRILVDPNNVSNLVVSTVRGGLGVTDAASGTNVPPAAPPRGVFVSSDGGKTFNRVLTGEATDLQANPHNFLEQYAGLGEIYGAPTNGLYRTTNGWQTSELISGPWLTTTNVTYTSTNYPIGTNINCYTNSGTNICFTNIVYTNIITGTNVTISTNAMGRFALAVSSFTNIYVGIAQPRTNYQAGLVGLWRTDNPWDPTPTWNLVPNPPYGSDCCYSPRFWYHFSLLVDPDDPAVLYLTEFDVWCYKNDWISIGDSIHPDNHVLAWAIGSGLKHLLLGNDGGVWLSDQSQVSDYWVNLNYGLAISQMYRGAVDPRPASPLALAGTQDNGTPVNNGSLLWPFVWGGDGGDCAISSAHPDTDWAVSLDVQFGSSDIGRVLSGVLPPTVVSGPLDTDLLPDYVQFYVHFEKSPRNDNLFIAGTAHLWRCDNFFSTSTPSWSTNGPLMTSATGAPVPISAMAFAPSDPSGLIYAFGTEDGQMLVTTDGGSSWNNLNPANAVPGRYISGLAFSPFDPNVLYVTLSGFDEGTPGHPGHLFISTNALASTPSWSNVSPPVNLPMNCLAIDPTNPNTIFVGSDIGVWQTSNGAASWAHHGPNLGMPNVAVFDLRMNSAGQPTAFTHGRGAFVFEQVNIPIINLLGKYGCQDCPPPPCCFCPLEFINPGDLVSIELPLQNNSPVPTVNLVANMMPSPQIVPFTPQQSYGVLEAFGPSVSRRFQFMANLTPGAVCGSTIQASFQLQDGTNNLGIVTMPFMLGTLHQPLVESFDKVQVPALPRNWRSASTGADAPWFTSTNPPPNILHDAEDPTPENGPVNTSVFTPDIPGRGESLLTTPPFVVATPQAQLYFRQAFSVSNGFDGCILEIAVGALPFQEITQAGGSIVQDGYNGRLNDLNPLGPRVAWSGDSGGWLPEYVSLPPSAAGQSVQLRWHFANSIGQSNGFWFIDKVQVSEPLCLPPVTNPLILNPTLGPNSFSFAINTVSSRTYVIQYKTNLGDTVWQVYATISGNGSQQTVSVTLGPDRQRFFRFVVE